ncbi:CFEM domain-containing protein [Xylaria sp. FL0933]|nr:CFEM domain-containing protein [Xylaria sp. FL0933]
MKTSSMLVVLAVLASVVSSQLEDIPKCGLECFDNAIRNTTCASAETTCICVNTALRAQAHQCILASCTIREQLAPLNGTNAQCGIAPSYDHSWLPPMLVFVILAGVVFLLRIVSRVVCHTKFWWDDFFNLLATVTSLVEHAQTPNSSASRLALDTLPFALWPETWASAPKPGQSLRKTLSRFSRCDSDFLFNFLDGAIPRIDAVARVLLVPRSPKVANRRALKDVEKEEAHAQNVADNENSPEDAVGLSPDRKNADVEELSIAFMGYRFTTLKSYNVGWNSTIDSIAVTLWSGLELDVALICACMPSIYPLFLHVIHRGRSAPPWQSIPDSPLVTIGGKYSKRVKRRGLWSMTGLTETRTDEEFANVKESSIECVELEEASSIRAYPHQVRHDLVS